MKKLINNVCLLGLTFLAACSSEEPIVTDSQKNSVGKTSFKITLNQAMERADKIFLKLDAESSLTRGGKRVPSNVICLKSDNSSITRSGDEELPDTMIYIINYGSNEGFAIMSADSRTRPIYAISDEGHFDMADTINNKGLSVFLARMGMDYMSSISGATILPTDSVGFVPNPMVPVNPGDDETYVYTKSVPSMLDDLVQTWGGNAPFNIYCPVVTDENGTGRATAGCVAVAMAQMMSHYEFPDHYKDQTYDWADIKSNRTSDDLAHLLADLGKPENLDTQYGLYSSGAYVFKIKGVFSNFGYLVPEDWKSLSHESAVSHLHIGGEPLLVDTRVEGYSTGHEWIIDGYRQFSMDRINWSEPYYHCVWGWQGSANGYYFFSEGEIDMSNPYILEYPFPSWMNKIWLCYNIKFLSGLEINPNYE